MKNQPKGGVPTGARRGFLRQSLWVGGVLALGGLTNGGCRSEKQNQEQEENTAAAVSSCTDLSGVSEGEIQKRNSLGYVEDSPIPENRCSNCNLYIPPANDQACGGCMLFQGPVLKEAYCTYWAPKVV